MWDNAKKRTTKRSKLFTLDRELTLNKVNTFCKNNYHCWDAKHPFKPSIDRLNSSLGYHDSNVQIVWLIENYCKNTFTTEDVIKFCKLKLVVKS